MTSREKKRFKPLDKFDFDALGTEVGVGPPTSSQAIQWDESDDQSDITEAEEEEQEWNDKKESPVFKRRTVSSKLGLSSSDTRQSLAQTSKKRKQEEPLSGPASSYRRVSRKLENSFRDPIPSFSPAKDDFRLMTPTQKISRVSSSDDDEEEVESDSFENPTPSSSSSVLRTRNPPSNKGSEFAKQLLNSHVTSTKTINTTTSPEESSYSASPSIESVRSSVEFLGKDDNPSGTDEEDGEEGGNPSFNPQSSGKKKSRARFGLCAKLEKVLKTRESDLALKSHFRNGDSVLLPGGGPGKGISVLVEHIVDEMFWKRFVCKKLGAHSERLSVIVKKGEKLNAFQPGAELLIKEPFYSLNDTKIIFGVTNFEVIDAPLNSIREFKIIKHLLPTNF